MLTAWTVSALKGDGMLISPGKDGPIDSIRHRVHHRPGGPVRRPRPRRPRHRGIGMTRRSTMRRRLSRVGMKSRQAAAAAGEQALHMNDENLFVVTEGR